MTAVQAKLIGAGALAFAAWLFRDRPRRPITASVDLGVGTVDGVFGGDYMTSAATPTTPVAPTPANPAQDPLMRALIDRSNAAIAADNLNPNDSGALL
jgi:hypothetical protein